MQKRPHHGVQDIYPMEQEGDALPLPETQNSSTQRQTER